MIMLNTSRGGNSGGDSGGGSGGGSSQRQPRFAVGQTVTHTRYGYRGVIVAMDMTCQAAETWYKKKQTQPPRDQPWYHVLVHASGSVTYVAQTSIEADTSGQAVDHPLVDMFFEGFDGKRYERNDEPWQG